MCAEPQPEPVAERGKLVEIDVMDAYAAHVAGFGDMAGDVPYAIDAANGMAGHTLPHILERLPHARAETMLMDLDGTFPNHEANPIKEKNLDPVRELVKQTGRAPRRVVRRRRRPLLLRRRDRPHDPGGPDDRLARHRVPGQATPALRSSTTCARRGSSRRRSRTPVAAPIRDRVGHSFIKATMRKEGAVFAGELSGHFYFKDNFTCDSGVIAMVSALNLLSRPENQSRPLSELVEALRRYHATGEINFRVDDTAASIAKIKEAFQDGRQDELDGITVEYGDLGDPDWWWFNVRASNTEPLLRLNLEAKSPADRDRAAATS